MTLASRARGVLYTGLAYFRVGVGVVLRRNRVGRDPDGFVRRAAGPFDFFARAIGVTPGVFPVERDPGRELRLEPPVPTFGRIPSTEEGIRFYVPRPTRW